MPQVGRWIEFDYCRRVRHDKDRIGVHFFEDDYKFERAWTSPNRYAAQLKPFGAVLGPDFSMYMDFPDAVSIYNHYRNNWLASFWQTCYNIDVIPTVLWGEERTWDWCFDGYPKNSIVAVSNVGLVRKPEVKKMFHAGYEEMLRRLDPSLVLVFSRNAEKLPGNVQYIPWSIHKGDQIDGRGIE